MRYFYLLAIVIFASVMAGCGRQDLDLDARRQALDARRQVNVTRMVASIERRVKVARQLSRQIRLLREQIVAAKGKERLRVKTISDPDDAIEDTLLEMDHLAGRLVETLREETEFACQILTSDGPPQEPRPPKGP